MLMGVVRNHGRNPLWPDCDNLRRPLSLTPGIPISWMSLGMRFSGAQIPKSGCRRFREDFMFRTAIRALATIAVVVATIALLASGADAAVGGGLSSGSRGMRTFAPPPATPTPHTARGR